jgi:hypothetical protein
MHSPSCSKDTTVSLCLTQQLDLCLQVVAGDDCCPCDGLDGNLHYVAIVTLKSECVTGKYIVLNDEQHCRLLIIGPHLAFWRQALGTALTFAQAQRFCVLLNPS